MSDLRLPPAPSTRPRGQRGGAAVEFAIVFPLFCALVFGIIDYGYYFYQRFAMAGAIRDGLRTGVTISQSVASPNDCATVAKTIAATDVGSGMSGATFTAGPI